MSNPFVTGALGAAGTKAAGLAIKGGWWAVKKAYRGVRAVGQKLRHGRDAVAEAVEAEDLLTVEDKTL